jgi:hypothetical protein
VSRVLKIVVVHLFMLLSRVLKIIIVRRCE